MKAKCVIFTGVNKFEMGRVELDNPGPQDMVVRTLVTAISPGTERWVLFGKHIGTQYPCVPGYHRIGIVEECGKEVSNFRPGDIVYGSSGRWKGDVLCMYGAHIEASVADNSQYYFVSSSMPRRLELETLAFTILAGVANRGIRFCDVHPTQRILIIGAGFIGLCAAQLARLKGAIPVLLDKDKERVEFAKKMYFCSLCADDENLEKALKEIAPSGFDAVYDSVGHAQTTDKMVQLTRNQGTLLLQAQYFDKERCALDLDQIKIKELTVKTTCFIDDKDRTDTVNNIRARLLKIAPLITHRFEADDALRGYELLSAGKPFNLGIVFRWDKRVSD